MELRAKLKKIIRKLDRLSPYPIFYPFVMSPDEKVVFDEAINESRHFLEFGLGGSSLRAIQKSKAIIYTVESSPEWISQMRKYLILRYFENKRLYIFPVDIGPTRDWDIQNQIIIKIYLKAYSSSIFELINKNKIDLTLIDGRFRVACTLKIIISCYENTNLKILIHDFWNREQYHVVLKYLDIVKKVGTIGLFTIKDSIDINSVKESYEAYKLNPQ